MAFHRWFAGNRHSSSFLVPTSSYVLHLHDVLPRNQSMTGSKKQARNAMLIYTFSRPQFLACKFPLLVRVQDTCLDLSLRTSESHSDTIPFQSCLKTHSRHQSKKTYKRDPRSNMDLHLELARLRRVLALFGRPRPDFWLQGQ